MHGRTTAADLGRVLRHHLQSTSIPHLSSLISFLPSTNFFLSHPYYTLLPMTCNKPRHLRLRLSRQKPENLLARHGSGVDGLVCEILDKLKLCPLIQTTDPDAIEPLSVR